MFGYWLGSVVIGHMKLFVPLGPVGHDSQVYVLAQMALNEIQYLIIIHNLVIQNEKLDLPKQDSIQ